MNAGELIWLGWYEALKQEALLFGIAALLFEPGFFRTKIMAPGNVKLRSFVQGTDGNHTGDPQKAVKIMVDVVKGEGGVEGKQIPLKLPIEMVRARCKESLKMSGEWESIVGDVGF
ncbi:hypothetical protein CC78DRAFT_578163 [Lojkania enalia]|uniref:Uncharacterized protein n=1 Tax=Lojkania enalia TaxID=147567 RepID=A0A9P4KEM0_9PLEO|nr:hypothetical protein CC78DRAFT_578163 [Didymosphaeria enalia]